MMTQEFIDKFFSAETVQKLRHHKTIRDVGLHLEDVYQMSIKYNDNSTRYFYTDLKQGNYIITETHFSAQFDRIEKEFNIDKFIKEMKHSPLKKKA